MANIEDLAEFTLEENIAYLDHSDLSYEVIVEGKDDVIIYRELEKEIDNVTVLPVGGRKEVLEMFETEQDNPNSKYIFIADKDTWCNTGIPEEYNHTHLIFTTGYSIENDVFIDHECQKIIDNHPNKNQFYQDKDKFIEWYALALQAKIDELNPMPDTRDLSTNPFHLFKKYDEFIQLLENETYPTDKKQCLTEEFPLTIHGKSLLTLFTKNCKEFKSQAMFQTVAVKRGDNIERIFNDVKEAFNLLQ